MQLYTGTSKLDHAWQKIQAVPTSFWWTILSVVVGIYVIVRVWRALKNFNDFAPYIGLFVVLALGTLYVVYERKEPAFLSSFVDALAQFLPTRVDGS